MKNQKLIVVYLIVYRSIDTFILYGLDFFIDQSRVSIDIESIGGSVAGHCSKFDFGY